jgi:hypothetical protein
MQITSLPGPNFANYATSTSTGEVLLAACRISKSRSLA